MLAIPVIIYVILIIFGILNIVLFFKLWGATNDIRKIREAICSTVSQADDNATTAMKPIPSAARTGIAPTAFSVSDWVTAKDNPEEVMYIDRINNVGEYVCKATDGRIVGAFNADRLVRA